LLKIKKSQLQLQLQKIVLITFSSLINKH